MSPWDYSQFCLRCGQPTGKGRAKGLCRSCYNKIRRAEYRATPEGIARQRESSNKSHQKHKRERNQATTARNRALRTTVIQKLGGTCACCGETEAIFLCLDHIKGGGRKEYVSLNGTLGIYRQVRDEGYPKDKYRVLCWNCNAALGLHGYCPHSTLTSPRYLNPSSPSLQPRIL